jgi:hypothetical protein
MADKIRKPSPRSSDGYEKKDVNLTKIVIFEVIGTVVLIAIVLLLINYTKLLREKVVYEEQLRPQSAALRELRARESEELNSYAVLDTVKGIYRIPIDRAMKLQADEAYRAESSVTTERK